MQDSGVWPNHRQDPGTITWEEKQLAARVPNRCLYRFCKNSAHTLKHLLNERVLRYPAGDPQLLIIPTGISPKQALTSLGILAIHTSLTKDQVPPLLSGKVCPSEQRQRKGKRGSLFTSEMATGGLASQAHHSEAHLCIQVSAPQNIYCSSRGQSMRGEAGSPTAKLIQTSVPASKFTLHLILLLPVM